MTKKISSTKPCGRNSKIYNGAFLKCFSIVSDRKMIEILHKNLLFIHDEEILEIYTVLIIILPLQHNATKKVHFFLD